MDEWGKEVAEMEEQAAPRRKAERAERARVAREAILDQAYNSVREGLYTQKDTPENVLSIAVQAVLSPANRTLLREFLDNDEVEG